MKGRKSKLIGILLMVFMLASCTYYSVCGDTKGDIDQKKDKQVEVDPDTTIPINDSNQRDKILDNPLHV